MYMKILISESQFDKLVKKLKDGERFIKCDACKKLFTQTFHKGKKSLPICPWCGKHNTQFNENQDVEERSRSFAFTRKKRLFSKPEMMANPARYKKHDRDMKEIKLYNFAENPAYKPGNPEEDRAEYERIIEDLEPIKELGDYVFYLDTADDDGAQNIIIHVLDKAKQLKIAQGDFEMRTSADIFVTLPYVRKEYRRRGIATEIYKTVLDFGDIISGKSQSIQAAGLWKKMFNELPNKMVFIDRKGNEHDIVKKKDKLVIASTGDDVHAKDIGGQLKIYRNQ